MYPALPFGPLTIPTEPFVILLALTIGLEVAGRFGRRLHLSIDDVWNTGLLWVFVSLIVARLWNVIQFWSIYIAEPWLIISLRPSGFVWPAGLLVGVIVAYSYLWRRAIDPLPMGVALGGGAIVGMALITAGTFLTGSLIGIPTHLPWALAYYGVLRHPVAFYYALGFGLIAIGGWYTVNKLSAGRVLLVWMVEIGVLLLVVGAYIEGSNTLGGLRISQLWGLIIALVASLSLAQHPPAKVDPVAAEA